MEIGVLVVADRIVLGTERQGQQNFLTSNGGWQWLVTLHIGGGCCNYGNRNAVFSGV